MDYKMDFGGFTPLFSSEESQSMRLLWGNKYQWEISPEYMREHALYKDKDWEGRNWVVVEVGYRVDFEKEVLEIRLYKKYPDSRYDYVSEDERGERTLILKGGNVHCLSFFSPLDEIPRFGGKTLFGEKYAIAKWSKWTNLWYPGTYYKSVVELPFSEVQKQAATLQQIAL